MERYGLRSFEEFTTTWNRAQLLVAIDAMFWNAAKEREKYGRSPMAADTRSLRAADVFAGLGF